MSNQEGEPDWLTEMDKEILDAMSTGLTLTPAIIAENIDRSRKGVSNRLSSLQAGGLVEKIERGKYEITDEGYQIHIGAPEGATMLLTDAERIGSRREEIQERRQIQRDLGVSKEEYIDQIMEEREKIKSEEPDCDDPFQEAVKRVGKRLREENKD